MLFRFKRQINKTLIRRTIFLVLIISGLLYISSEKTKISTLSDVSSKNDKTVHTTTADSSLVQWVQQRLIPPSKSKYNIGFTYSGLLEEEERYNTNKFVIPSQQFIIQTFEEMAGNEAMSRGGTFVEAGAFDGEFMSNTLFLEVEYGWNGVLIEANPKFFRKLLTKQRKSWTINVCLNTKPFLSQEEYLEIDENSDVRHIIGSNQTHELDKQLNLGSSGLKDFAEIEPGARANTTFKVDCVPLYAIIKALNYSHIDFFSLDVQGSEMGVLASIPWDKVSFSFMAIEHRNKEDLQHFFKDKGYLYIKSNRFDHIFVNVNLTVIKSPL